MLPRLAVATTLFVASLAPAQGAALRTSTQEPQGRGSLEQEVARLRQELKQLHAELDRLAKETGAQDAEEPAKAQKKEPKATSNKSKQEAGRPRVLRVDKGDVAVIDDVSVGVEVEKPRVLTLRDGGVHSITLGELEDGKSRTLVIKGDGTIQQLQEPKDGEAGDRPARVRLVQPVQGKATPKAKTAPAPTQGCTCDCPCCQAHRAGAVVTAPQGGVQFTTPRVSTGGTCAPARTSVRTLAPVQVVEAPKVIRTVKVPKAVKAPKAKVEPSEPAPADKRRLITI